MKHSPTAPRPPGRAESAAAGAGRPTATRPHSISLPPGLFSLSVYTILSLILTYPLLFNLTGAVPNDIGDPLLNTWILAWDSHALLSDPFNLFQANIFYPLPDTLAYSEHLFSTALLALPGQLSAGEPILAYNLMLLATFPLAAFGMYLLALRWTGRRDAAFVAGLVFAFNPYRFAAIAHLQLLTFQWLPFALLSLDLLLNRSTARDASRISGKPVRFGEAPDMSLPKISDTPTASATNQKPAPARPASQTVLLLTIFLLLQILASWYLALYTALIMAVYLLFALFTGRIELSGLGRLVAALLMVILLSLPFIRPYLSLVDDLRAARPLSLALSLAAAPADFAAAAPFNRLFGPLTEPLRARPNFTEENMLFLGLGAPLLGLIALLIRLKDYLLRTAFHEEASPCCLKRQPVRNPLHASRFTFYVLLTILVLALLLTFPRPYALLATLFPFSSLNRVPPRWIIPAIFALAGLAAYGYTIITDDLSRFSPKLAGGTFRAVWPVKLCLRLKPRLQSCAPGVEALAGQKGNSYTINLPFDLKSGLPMFIVCLLLIAETFSAPLPLAQVANHSHLNPAYRRLAQQGGDLALIELPLHSAPAPEYPEVKRLYASTLGWWQLVNGYSGYTPPRQPQLARALADFPNQAAIAALQELAAIEPESAVPPPGSLTASTTPSPPRPLYLLVHPGEDPLDRSQWETAGRWQAERNPALRPLGQFEGDYLYQILPPDPQRFAPRPLAVFGQAQNIYLLAVEWVGPPLTGRPLQALRVEPFESQPESSGLELPASNPGQADEGLLANEPGLIFYWQAVAALDVAYTVFIHLRAPDGFVRSQADGPPVGGHYPTTAWQAGEIIQDIHALPAADFSQIDHLAIGLYDPATGQRLPAFGPDGQRLAADALIIPFEVSSQ